MSDDTSRETAVGPEDALSTKKSQHDYSGLMRLESPHEMVATDPGEPNRLEDQAKRVNKGEAPVDGTGSVPPGGDASAEPAKK